MTYEQRVEQAQADLNRAQRNARMRMEDAQEALTRVHEECAREVAVAQERLVLIHETRAPHGLLSWLPRLRITKEA